MSSVEDLHDPTKICIFIPHNASEDDQEQGLSYQESHPSASRDVSNGHALRLHVYRHVWGKCLARIQDIFRKLHAPVIKAVTTSVLQAYDASSTLPMLPYPELPVVAVSVPDGNNALLPEILEGIEQFSSTLVHRDLYDDDMEEGAGGAMWGKPLVSRVNPSDFGSLSNAMKAIISGFKETLAEELPDVLPPKRTKATVPLIGYDMNVLVAWYNSLRKRKANPPQLVVLIPNFESVNPAIMQDIFQICSQYIPTLPLIFLLCLSVPSAVSWIHQTYPRSILALLRIDGWDAPRGMSVTEEIMRKVFFDIDFAPDVVLGTTALAFIAEFCSRYTASVDALILVLQIAYFRHFQDPLTILVHVPFSLPSEATDETASFWHALLARVRSYQDSTPLPDGLFDASNPSIPSLVTTVDYARTTFQNRTLRLKLGYQVLRIVRSFFREKGYKTSLSGDEARKDRTEAEIEIRWMERTVRGDLDDEVKYLGRVVRKLPPTELDTLLERLYTMFHNIGSSKLRREEENTRFLLANARNALSASGALDQNPVAADEASGSRGFEVDQASPVNEEARNIAGGIGDWFFEYVSSRLQRLDEGLLWDLWSTGYTPFPSDLVNPAPRLTVINALSHPYDIADNHTALFPTASPANGTDAVSEAPRARALWELPDTSILFRRYLEASRVINVYDWFESFSVVLDMQRRKQGQQPEEGTENEEDEERWRIEVQARFMRAIHELDWMGFLKHTKRKQDHVIRTIYDPLD